MFQRAGHKISRNFGVKGFRQFSTGTQIHDSEIVVAGGGVIGLGVAYCLAKEGYKSVLVLEKENALCTQTTSKAAGLIGQVRADVDQVLTAMDSVREYSELQNSNDPDAQVPNWRQTGSLRVGQDERRIKQFQDYKDVCEKAGLEVHLLEPSEAEKLWPGMNFSKDVLSILYCPSDGYLQPSDLGMTYRYHAKKMGVKFATGTRIDGISLDQNKRVTGVETNRGSISCDVVISAAGFHGFHLCKMVGVRLPIFPVQHQYFITEPITSPPIDPNSPVLRFVDQSIYSRPDVNSFLCGGWERNPLVYDPESSLSSETTLPDPDTNWNALSKFAEDIEPLYPPVQTHGIRHVSAGYPCFTPDGKFIIGPVPSVKGFYVAAGCNAHGINGSFGMGDQISKCLQQSDQYLSSFSPNRFVGEDNNETLDWQQAMDDTRNVYETYYKLPGTV